MEVIIKQRFSKSNISWKQHPRKKTNMKVVCQSKKLVTSLPIASPDWTVSPLVTHTKVIKSIVCVVLSMNVTPNKIWTRFDQKMYTHKTQPSLQHFWCPRLILKVGQGHLSMVVIMIQTFKQISLSLFYSEKPLRLYFLSRLAAHQKRINCLP